MYARSRNTKWKLCIYNDICKFFIFVFFSLQKCMSACTYARNIIEFKNEILLPGHIKKQQMLNSFWKWYDEKQV